MHMPSLLGVSLIEHLSLMHITNHDWCSLCWRQLQNANRHGVAGAQHTQYLPSQPSAALGLGLAGAAGGLVGLVRAVEEGLVGVAKAAEGWVGVGKAGEERACIGKRSH